MKTRVSIPFHYDSYRFEWLKCSSWHRNGIFVFYFTYRIVFESSGYGYWHFF